MKHTHIIIIIIVTVLKFSAFSQNTTVDYKIIFNTIDEKNEKLKNSFFFKVISESEKDINYELTFNDSVSSFKAKEMLDLDIKNKVKFASNLIVEGNYYRNIKSNKIIKNAYGINYFFEKELVWKTENESKIIDSILCYKATTEKKVTNSKGVLTLPITAWYAPSLPYQYGPSEYGNLPGLIVELHERNFIIFIDKITFNSDKKVDEMPTKNVLTEDEYKKKMKKRLEN